MPFKHFATLVIWDNALPDEWELDDEHSNWPANPVIDGLPYRLESKRYNDAVYALDIEAFKSKNTALAEEKKVLIDTIEDGRRIINNRYEDAKEAHQYRLRLEAEIKRLKAEIEKAQTILKSKLADAEDTVLHTDSGYAYSVAQSKKFALLEVLKIVDDILPKAPTPKAEGEKTVEEIARDYALGNGDCPECGGYGVGDCKACNGTWKAPEHNPFKLETQADKELLLLGILRDAYLATIPNGTKYAKVMMETRAILRTGLANHIGIQESEFYGGREHAEALLAKALNTFEKELQDITHIEPKEHNPFALATHADKDEVIDIIFPPVESDLLISGTITNLKKNLVRKLETIATFTLMGAQVVYVTAFPRTYEKYKEALKEGNLIRAELKHDTSRYPTGHFILVSIVTPGAKHG